MGFAVGDVQKLWIKGPAGRLEAALRTAFPARAAALVVHPHPLYGGTLHNPVVYHSDREMNRAGLTTLRVNLRGAGESEGVHDEGRGEVEDIGAAVSFLRGVAPGVASLLVGYSFGSWCGLRYARIDPEVAALVAIGLPVRIYSFEDLQRLARPLGVIQGSADQLGTPGEIESLLKLTRPPGRLWVVEAADHLFSGRAPEAAGRVLEAVEHCLERIAVRDG